MKTCSIPRLESAGRGLAAVLAVGLLGLSAFGQGLGAQWEGLRAPTGSVPPDVHGAPGPAGVIATVNLRIAYFNKAGGTNWGPVELHDFWSSVGNSGNGLSDPMAIFDPDTRRFFVI